MLSHIIIDLRTVVDESWKIKDITLYGIKAYCAPSSLEEIMTNRAADPDNAEDSVIDEDEDTDYSSDESCEDEEESDND